MPAIEWLDRSLPDASAETIAKWEQDPATKVKAAAAALHREARDDAYRILGDLVSVEAATLRLRMILGEDVYDNKLRSEHLPRGDEHLIAQAFEKLSDKYFNKIKDTLSKRINGYTIQQTRSVSRQYRPDKRIRLLAVVAALAERDERWHQLSDSLLISEMWKPWRIDGKSWMYDPRPYLLSPAWRDDLMPENLRSLAKIRRDMFHKHVLRWAKKGHSAARLLQAVWHSEGHAPAPDPGEAWSLKQGNFPRDFATGMALRANTLATILELACVRDDDMRLQTLVLAKESVHPFHVLMPEKWSAIPADWHNWPLGIKTYAEAIHWACMSQSEDILHGHPLTAAQ